MDLDQGSFIFCLLFSYLLLFITFFFSFYNNSMLRKNQSIVSMIYVYEMFLYDNS